LGAGQVNESEVTLISADDISKDYISRDGAPSPQFFIPEPSEDNISSMSYSPKYTQANEEQTGQILEPNLLNREAREIDANLAREVMMNANLGDQTVVETIDPILLLPILPSNPEPVEAEDSPLSSIGDEELSKLEQEIFNQDISKEEEASVKTIDPFIPPAPVEVGDPEAIIISSDDSSSEAPSPEAYDDNLGYVAEAIHRERGYKYLTVAIDRMLAVMTPVRGGIEPRLLGVENNRCYYVEMTIDTNYRVFP